jgi:diguanylate cyclase (GGDEF)-like protein/PAS domain S-box-containing protein
MNHNAKAHNQSCNTQVDTVQYSVLSETEKEQILTLQQAILELVAHGHDHKEIIDNLCRLEEQLLPNSVASVMLLDEKQHCLNVFAAPSIPEEGVRQLNGLRPGPGAGSCGNVIYHKEPVFVTDTLTDDRWVDIRPLAIHFNLMACWSMPIYTEGRKIIGTFALSSFEHRAPSQFHRKLLEIGASIIGIVLERNKQAEFLRLSAKVFESSGECIVITDARQRILSVNSTFTKITGYSSEEVQGQQPGMLNSSLHDPEFFQNMSHTLQENGYWQGEIWDQRKNGNIYPLWLGLTAIRDNNNQISNYIGIFSDISERKEAEARIRYLAQHDVLTGLPNRTMFTADLVSAIASAKKLQQHLALLFIDLDHFKNINDSLGHHYGDLLLKATAERLKSRLKASDSICRQGGDEFILILQDIITPDEVAHIAERLISVLSTPIQLNEHEVTVSASIGIALYPEDGDNEETLVKNADAAMYHAKQSGRDQYRFFVKSLNDSVHERLTIENGLRKALERNEFELYYQPQINLVSGKMTGVEALIRWHHPEFGMVPPSRFIPVAEDSGMIIPIGDWVLKEACRQAAAWHQNGLEEIMMAVNLSAVQFRRGDMVKSIYAALETSGLDPAYLELELTESILIQDTEKVLATVQQLKALGVKLAIDDFGTGYSSLSYLKRFNVDKLKIDQSFIRNMVNDPSDAAIVHAIIQMASSLKLRTIAEGVEDQSMLAPLRLHHCDEAQGYYFARPMPADELMRYATAKTGK